MSLQQTMQAVVYDGTPYSVGVENLPIPSLVEPEDAIVRMNVHEGVGVVVEIGTAVESHTIGDIVVIPDNVDSGLLDLEAPELNIFGLGHGPDGGLDGTQAEYVRVPQADHSLIPIDVDDPDEEMFETLTMLSDILPTAWTSLDYAGFVPGDSVAVFGAGPVGLLATYTAILRGASRVYAVDQVPSRLELAREIGAHTINFLSPLKQRLKVLRFGS